MKRKTTRITKLSNDLPLGSSITPEILRNLDVELNSFGDCNVFAAHGMLCAIFSGPHEIPESLWMPVMWGLERKFASLSEQRALRTAILQLKEQVTGILKERYPYYPLVRYGQKYNDPVLLDDLPNLILWSRGYLQGIALAWQFWKICIDKIECFILPIRKLAGIHENMVRQKIIEKNTEQLEELLTQLEKILATLIPAIYDYWHSPEVIKRYNKKLNKLIAAEKKNGNVNADEIKLTLGDKVAAIWKATPQDLGYGNISGAPFLDYIGKTQH